MSTEDINPRYLDLDLWETGEGVAALFEAQAEAVAAVRASLPAITAAVEAAAPRLRADGRLVYVGAGTSGRLGALDGAELPPTFDWPRERMVTLLAGGEAALLQAVENAEDDGVEGAQRVATANVGASDVVIGIAASGTTPFTVAAIEAARARGALTIGIACTEAAPLLRSSEHAVFVATGAEPIAGSTRFKAGTAQKVVLNLISTELMVRLGRVHRGMMVHMRPSNAKLRKRAQRMVTEIAGVDEVSAAAALAKAGNDVRIASLVARGLDAGAAAERLEAHNGNLRAALAGLS